MKIGIIILCRYDSTRLPGKILKKISNTPILEIIINQLKLLGPDFDIVIATSDNNSDDTIVETAERLSIPYYRGDLNNVSLRFLYAAQLYHFEKAFRINGDNLFVNRALIKQMALDMEENDYDFMSNVPGRSWGYGMSVEAIDVEFMENILHRYKTAEYKEHVTKYLYDNPELGKRKYYTNDCYENLKGKQLAIDTPEDFKKLSDIYIKLEKHIIDDSMFMTELNSLVI